MHFNSHAHVERDFFTDVQLRTVTISTHTLTWSVTDTLIENLPAIIISTHTLTWSVTSAVAISRFRNVISTHTLTWSVTVK